MFKIIGNQPSADVLRQAVKDLDTTQLVVVNWGVTRRPQDENAFYLNNTPRLNSIEQLDCFRAAGLATPMYTTNLEEAKDWVREGRKVWGRRLEHTRGNDIVGTRYRPPTKRKPEYWNRQWLDRDFWVQFIPDVVNEWRVHIFQGRCIAKGRKVQTGPATRTQLVRSRNNGWTLDHTTELPDHVRETARRACAASGYNFGAIDCLELPHQVVVPLEINSAPALGSQYTIDAYTQALAKVAKGGYRKIYEGKPPV